MRRFSFFLAPPHWKAFPPLFGLSLLAHPVRRRRTSHSPSMSLFSRLFNLPVFVLFPFFPLWRGDGLFLECFFLTTQAFGHVLFRAPFWMIRFKTVGGFRHAPRIFCSSFPFLSIFFFSVTFFWVRFCTCHVRARPPASPLFVFFFPAPLRRDFSLSHQCRFVPLVLLILLRPHSPFSWRFSGFIFIASPPRTCLCFLFFLYPPLCPPVAFSVSSPSISVRLISGFSGRCSDFPEVCAPLLPGTHGGYVRASSSLP